MPNQNHHSDVRQPNNQGIVIPQINKNGDGGNNPGTGLPDVQGGQGSKIKRAWHDKQSAQIDDEKLVEYYEADGDEQFFRDF